MQIILYYRIGKRRVWKLPKENILEERKFTLACEDINKSVRQWLNCNTASDKEKLDKQICSEYEELKEMYSKEVEEDSIETFGELKEMDTEKKEEKIHYYTIIPKELARAEIPELVEYYPNHSFYCIIEEEEYIRIATDKNGEMGYYPSLDCAEQQKRNSIMEEFFSRLDGKYIQTKYEDLFED